MKIDRYTKVVLTVVALALALIAMRPLFSPTPSYAARAIEYKVVNYGTGGPAKEKRLNEMGKDGWDLVLDVDGLMVMKR
jgi:hypothetical protein